MHISKMLKFYTDMGFYVFPCNSDKTSGKFKQPLTVHGFKDAVNSFDEATQLFKGKESALIGVDCARSNLVVIDIDVKDGRGGMESWYELESPHGVISTWSSETPNQGMHIYFKAPDSFLIKNAQEKWKGIDIRASGGYVILPDNRFYHFTKHGNPKITPIADLPQWLIDKLKEKDEKKEPLYKKEIFTQGIRNGALYSLAGRALSLNLSKDIVSTILDVANEKKCDSPIPQSELDAIKQSIGKYELPEIEIKEDEIISIREIETFPEELNTGIFKDYISLSKETTSASEITHYVTLLAAIGASLRRSVYMEYGMELYPNLYCVILGKSHDFKTTSTRRILNIIDTNRVETSLGEESAQALIDWLSNDKSNLIFKSEFTSLQKIAGWKGSTLSTLLMELYDCPPSYSIRYRSNSKTIQAPTLSILGCTTIETFWSHMSDMDVTSGFLNRFSFFSGIERDFISLPKAPIRAVEHAKKSIEEIISNYVNSPYPHVMYLDDKARDLWEAWFRLHYDSLKDKPDSVASPYRRLPNLALKTSMIWSVTRKGIEINEHDITKGIITARLARKTLDYMMSQRQLPEYGNSRKKKLEEKIIKLCKKMPMTIRNLVRFTNSSYQEIEQAIPYLIKSKAIEQTGITRKKTPVFYAKTVNDEST